MSRIRVIVYKSNKSIEAQAMDSGVIFGKKYTFKKDGSPVDQALKFGQSFGKKIKELGVKDIKFDRNNNRYHGRIKSFADGMRNSGINF